MEKLLKLILLKIQRVKINNYKVLLSECVYYYLYYNYKYCTLSYII